MKRIHFFLLGILLLGQRAQAQDQATYDQLVEQAWALYEAKDYSASANAYTKAFEALGWKGTANDRYNAACSHALAGVPDSAFAQLFRLAERMDYANLDHLTKDADLIGLHADPRWQRLVQLVQANKDRIEAHYDQPLVALLDTVFDRDQTPRHAIKAIEDEFGRDSKEMQAHWQHIHEGDSINVLIVTKILDDRGWLGADVIGGKGNQTLLLVIQHADPAIRLKYLPMMREAVARGDARASSLALLEDRVALEQGRKQLYGSQIGYDEAGGRSYVLPLEDPDHVDERRASMGLGPMADYVKHFGLTWDLDAYKRELPALEDLQKQR